LEVNKRALEFGIFYVGTTARKGSAGWRIVVPLPKYCPNFSPSRRPEKEVLVGGEGHHDVAVLVDVYHNGQKRKCWLEVVAANLAPNSTRRKRKCWRRSRTAVGKFVAMTRKGSAGWRSLVPAAVGPAVRAVAMSRKGSAGWRNELADEWIVAMTRKGSAGWRHEHSDRFLRQLLDPLDLDCTRQSLAAAPSR
jgi:hypothetical protein